MVVLGGAYGGTLPVAEWYEVRGRRSFDGMGSSSSGICAAQDDTELRNIDKELSAWI